MAGSLNKVMLIGHLGAAPEIRATTARQKVATFSVATGDRWRDKATGERREKTEWHRVVIFNEQLVGFAEQYLKKGSAVFLQGQLGTRKWTDRAGIERWTTEIVLGAFRAELVLLDRAERSPAAESPDDYGTGKAATTPNAAAGETAGSRGTGDEIPF